MPFAYEDFDFITRDPLFEGPQMILNKKLRRHRLLSSIFYTETYSQLYFQDLSYYKNVTQVMLERRLKFSYVNDLTFRIFHRIDQRDFLLEKNRYIDLLPNLKIVIQDIVKFGFVNLFDYFYDQFFIIYPQFFSQLLVFNFNYSKVKTFKKSWVLFKSSIYRHLSLFLLNCIRRRISFRLIKFTTLVKQFNKVGDTLFLISNVFFIFRKFFSFLKKFINFSKSSSLQFKNDYERLHKPLHVSIFAKSILYPSFSFTYKIYSPSYISFYDFSLKLYEQVYGVVRNRISYEPHKEDHTLYFSNFFFSKPFDLLQNLQVSLNRIRNKYTRLISIDPYLRGPIEKIHYIFPKMFYNITNDLLIDKSKSLVSNILPIKNFYFFLWSRVSYDNIYNEYLSLFTDRVVHWDKMKFFFFNSSFMHLPSNRMPLSIHNYKVFNRLLRRHELKINDNNFFLKFNVQKKIIGMLMKHGFLYRTKTFLDEVFVKMKTQMGRIVCSRAFLSCIMQLRPNAIYVPYKIAGDWKSLFKPVHTYRRYSEGLKLFKTAVDGRFHDRLQGDMDWPYSSAMVMEWYDVISNNLRSLSWRFWLRFEDDVGKMRFLTMRKRPSSLIPFDKNKYSIHRFLFNKFQHYSTTGPISSLKKKKKVSTPDYFKLFNKKVEARVSLKSFKPTETMDLYNNEKSKYFNTSYKSNYKEYGGKVYKKKYLPKPRKRFENKFKVAKRRNRVRKIKKFYE